MSDIGAMSSGNSVTGQLDVQWIVEQIIYAKQQPIRDLEVFENFYEAKKTAFQELNTKVSSLESSLYNVINGGFQSKSVSTSSSDYFTATASTSAAEGSYSVVVKQLASARASASDSANNFSSTEDKVLNSGVLTVAGQAYDFGASNMSLNDLASDINTRDLGVNATVVNYGTEASKNYRIVLTAEETGTDNAFTMTDTSNLGMGDLIAAKDAQIYVNTDPEAHTNDYITRSTNTITDVITGVTLNLEKAVPDSVDPIPLSYATNVKVSTDSSGLKDKIQSFVDSFNDTMEFLNGHFTYDEENERAGVLSGETTARKVKEDLLSMITDRVDGAVDSYSSFSVIGITINRQGQLEIDDETLDEVISDHLDGVKQVFRDIGNADHSEVGFVGFSSETVAGTYAVEITQAATRATATGAAAATTLDADETLTVNYNGTDYTVALADLDTANDVVNKINTQFGADNDNIPVFAQLDGGGNLQIVTEDYGASQSLIVQSSNGSSNTGFGAQQTGDGLNVEGTIGGVTSTGSGQLLTATGEGDAKGLSITVATTSVAGPESKGSVTFTRGIGELLRERMYEISFPYDGLVARNIDSLEDTLENISDKIKDINRSLATEQEILITQYTRANEALAQMEYLKSTIAGG